MKGNGQVHPRVMEYAQRPASAVQGALDIGPGGLDEEQVSRQREALGDNALAGQQKDSVWLRLRRAFVNPFSVVLGSLAIISLVTDRLLEAGLRHGRATVLIILAMLLVSGMVRFTQELRAKAVTDRLTGLIDATVQVRRSGRWRALSAAELVVGDLVRLKAGERVPADLRILSAEDCYVSQAMLTGESGIRQKNAAALTTPPASIGDYTNTLFMGSTVTGGRCSAVVLAVGRDTACGGWAESVPARKTGFDRGANSIAWVLIKFMLLLVPVVFLASGLTKGEWLTAFLFALSVAVGLTPELLPMVITACMVRGSSCMSRKQTLVKNINAMQGFGSMDVLCVDKTGTLTGDTVLLEYYMDVLGNESGETLDCAYLNSRYHTGAANFMDRAVLHLGSMPGQEEHFRALTERFTRLDELPFDYQRKSAGVLVADGEQRYILVKGDVDCVVSRCSHVSYRGRRIPIEPELLDSVHNVVDEMLEDGMKVLAVAAKTADSHTLTRQDETELTLLGYLAFFDAPKQSAAEALRRLRALNISVKVLTGDHAVVAASICRRLNIPADKVLTGAELAALSDNEAQLVIERTHVFAELTPGQKEQVVELLQSNGHTVGFLGDGLNDLPAEVRADVGISVDTACEAMKEAADVILLKKDLNVLGEGVLEGRKAFANMTKYIKITASSNFGNIFAVVAASICLPFFPMTSLQLLLLNLLYDILCLVLPWDRVDGEVCRAPLDWSGKTLPRFMVCFGSISTVFDLLTFAFLFWGLCPALCGGAFSALDMAGQLRFIALFQTGWFLESMWTQVLILHLLRTRHLPLLQSRPSRPVLFVTLAGIALFTAVSMTGVGAALGMTALPPVYFAFLALVVGLYLLSVSWIKRCYLRRFGDFL